MVICNTTYTLLVIDVKTDGSVKTQVAMVSDKEDLVNQFYDKWSIQTESYPSCINLSRTITIINEFNVIRTRTFKGAVDR